MVFERLLGIGALDPGRFAKTLLKRARKVGAVEGAELDLETFQIRSESFTMSLANIYNQFLSLSRWERVGFLSHMVEMMAQLGEGPPFPESWEEAQEQLLPRIRHRMFLTLADLQARAGGGEGLVFENSAVPLAGDLVLTLVIDSEHTMGMVTDTMLSDWGVTFDEARAVAERRLLDRSLDPFEQVAPGLWAAPWSDDYAPSRIVFPHLLQKVTTNPLVCVPNRALLLVASSRDDDALTALVLFLARAAEEESYPLTRQLFHLQEHDLVPIPFPAEHPVPEIGALHARLLAREIAAQYEDQKPLLQELEGEDVFVASYMLFEGEDGEHFSCATWTRGVPTLLPTVSKVILIAPEEHEPETVPWEAPWDAIQAAKLLEPTGADPERWRTGEFPGEDWLTTHAKRMDRA